MGMRAIQVGESGNLTLRNESLGRYFNEVNRIPLLEPDQETEIAIKAANGDTQARDLLVRSNLKFVISVAKQYNTQDIDKFQDLVNEGNFGLIEAANSFDPSKGFKFISYAVWHIRKNMIKYLTNYGDTVRIPQNKFNDLNKLKKAEDSLTQKLGRLPSFEESFEAVSKIIKSANGYSVKKADLIAAMNSKGKPARLEGKSKYGEEFTAFPIDVIDGDVNNLDDDFDRSHFMHQLKVALSTLKPRDREVFEMRHGLGDAKYPMSLVEIGHRYGQTREAVRQVYKRAVRRLKFKLRNIHNIPTKVEESKPNLSKPLRYHFRLNKKI